MILNLGDFPTGSTVYVPFHTFSSDDPSASMTITGLAVTDIEIYKNGGTTQRSSDAGYTVAADFDGAVGLHGITIDTSDNTDANFYVAGADYWVAVNSITLDGATVRFWAGTFSIENRRVAGELVRTTIESLASQTSFTLAAGGASGDDDAYNNCTIIVSDIASGVQKAVGRISDYTGITRTVTLAADPGIFTMAIGDNVSIIATSAFSALATVATEARLAELDAANLPTDIDAILVDTNSLNDTKVPQTLNLTASGNIGIDWANVENPSTAVDLAGTDIQLVDTTTTNTDMRGTDSAALATVATEARLAELDAANLPTDVDAILTDTNSLNDTKIPNTLNTTALGNIGIDWANVENPTTALDLSGTDIQLVDTTTTNTDMRGTDNAALASVLGALADAAAAGVPTATDTVMAYVKQLINSLGTDDKPLISTDAQDLSASLDVNTKTVSANALTASALAADAANEIADALLDRADGVEPASGGTERTVREALRLILAASAGKLSGAATTTVNIRDTNDAKNRISATVDSDGNRSAVTLDDT